MEREELVLLPVEQLANLILQQAETIRSSQEQNNLLAERLTQLEAELAKLKPPKGKSSPDWVKANKPKSKPKPSAKYGHKGFARKREEPTRRVQHTATSCPDCGRSLRGGWVKRRRQVLHIPIVPAEVIEHEIIARRCPKCHKDVVPKVDLSTEVAGKHRVSIQTMSLIATLRERGRLPIETIQWMLKAIYGLALSCGEVVEILHTVADRAKGAEEQLKGQVRASPVVNADETGWRQTGQNGYVWTFSTPQVRFFVYRQSRSGKLVNEILGEDFEGCLVTDFYAGYNRMEGRHQRCWVHLLRDIHELRQESPEDEQLQKWAERVRQIYERAKAFRGRDQPHRERAQHCLERMLSHICQPFLKQDVPQRTLCERIERYLPELFAFVADPRVPSDNNAAERSLRPLVVGRKISGGTRTEKGSSTRMTLATLFGTWKLAAINPLDACSRLLLSPQV